MVTKCRPFYKKEATTILSGRRIIQPHCDLRSHEFRVISSKRNTAMTTVKTDVLVSHLDNINSVRQSFSHADHLIERNLLWSGVRRVGNSAYLWKPAISVGLFSLSISNNNIGNLKPFT